ncbi:MAG: RNA chaperone Hfq [Clostridiales bacterium]|jgi:host factor-I protein|nr:RNA chaperone Hfq [Clostridiales bacterium]
MKELILQDIILNQARREKSKVTVKLVSGDIITGTIRGFDANTLIIDDEDRQIMLYKKNILYVQPSTPVLKDMP